MWAKQYKGAPHVRICGLREFKANKGSRIFYALLLGGFLARVILNEALLRLQLLQIRQKVYGELFMGRMIGNFTSKSL